jgi:beta-fructofuranosidase
MSLRPQLHFTAREGWVSDPLGLTHHNGTYHLFFQYVPGTKRWTPECRWGHATSTDLLRWTELPVALAPGDGDDGCWSGSVVVPADRDPILLYTSVQLPDSAIGRIRAARPADDDWREWVKGEVVAEAPAQLAVTAFRDPSVIREGDVWRMLVGASTQGRATVLVYTSTNLLDWAYTGQLAQRSAQLTRPVWTGTLWECPHLVRFGDRYVLVVSVWDDHTLHYVAAAVGTYHDGVFDADTWHRLTYGPGPYAATTYLDDQGRPGMLAWLRRITDPSGAWAGALTMPALLAIDQHGEPFLSPHPNISPRRREALDAASWPTGAAVYLDWSPEPGVGDTLVIGGDEGTALMELRAADRTLTVTRVGGHAGTASTMPWPDADITLILDGPVLEAFCGGALLAAPIDARHQRVLAATDGGPGRYRHWLLETAPATAPSEGHS